MSQRPPSFSSCTYLWEWPNTTASTPARSAGTSLSVVDHEKGHAAQGYGEIVREGLRPVLVVVAPDDVQRRILPQLIHDALPVDISAMEDGVGGL